MLKVVERIQLRRLREYLKQYGYLPQVPRKDLERLDESSTMLREAVRKLQLMFPADLIGPCDGWAGPKTLAVISFQRCQIPDYFDDPELLSDPLVSAMSLVGAGSGSWPTSCHETGIKVYIDTSNAPSFIDVDAIFANSRIQYGKVGVKLVRHPTSSGAHIRQSWRVLAGGTIGLAQFNSRSCSDSVFNYRDPGFRGSEITQFNLDLHELGHNHNLSHTNGGIMNPSILGTKPAWVEFDASGNITYQDVSYSTLVRYFGGKPIDVIPPPPPPPPPDPDTDPCAEFVKALFEGCK